MQALGRHSVRFVNTTFRRTGTLWEGRYKASIVESERSVLTCDRSLALHPVQAGLVGEPGEYVWSRDGPMHAVHGMNASRIMRCIPQISEGRTRTPDVAVEHVCVVVIDGLDEYEQAWHALLACESWRRRIGAVGIATTAAEVVSLPGEKPA